MKDTHFVRAYLTITTLAATVTGRAKFERSREVHVDINENFSDFEVGTSSDRSVIVCSVTCYINDDCRAFLVNHQTGECRLYNQDISVSTSGPLLSGDSYSYYKEKAINLVAGRGQYSWSVSNYTRHGGFSYLALDGNNSPYYYVDESCMHTGRAENPWWAVDIGSSVKFRKIVIYQRLDSCCVHRFANITLLLGNSVAEISDYSGTVIATYDGPASSDIFPIVIQLGTVARGRYLKIYKEISNGFLCFCEIQVFPF